MTGLSTKTGLAPQDTEFLHDPIAFFDREHLEQAEVFRLLKALADDPLSASAMGDAETVLANLTGPLALHIADEEEDLFPALARHCAGERMFERMRAQLSKEHETDHALAAKLMEDLRALSEGRSIADERNFVITARAFAELQERHIAWEESGILPLARARLTPEDLRGISQSMAARRGLDPQPR